MCPDCINIVRLGNQNISLRWHADTQENRDFLPRTVLCQLGGGHINIWRHLAGNVFKRNRQTLKCASFLLFMPIGVISETCVYFLEYLEGSYAFFLSIVPYILNEGSLFFCKYVFMFILYPLYTVYNKTCQLQRCLSKNESRSELSAIPFLSGNKLSLRKSFDRSRQTNHNTFASFHRLLCRWCSHHICKWHLHWHFTWWKKLCFLKPFALIN